MTIQVAAARNNPDLTAVRIRAALACGRFGCSCTRPSGNTHCPAHNDREPSFSVNVKAGVLLVHCLAGCPQEAVIDALRERGLWPQMRAGLTGRAAPTTSTAGSPAAMAPKRQSEITRYEIRDASGEMVAIHVRRDFADGSKSFAWESADGSSGLNGRRAETLPLYGSEYLPGLPDDAMVVVVEGEKACEALRSRGIAAAATVTGAGVTPSEDVLRPLLRLQPTLWPDNDAEGRRHMERIAGRLLVLRYG